jgi:integrase
MRNGELMADSPQGAKKRGAGDGSYRLRPDGRWEVRLTLPSGKSKSYYGKTRQEAQQKHRAALRELENGRDLAAKRQTVGQFLHHWLESVVRSTLAPKTYSTYCDIVRLHLTPDLGRVPLDRLTPLQVASLLQRKRSDELSPRTVHHIRAVLRAALNQAVKWQLITRNVATLVDSPRQLPSSATPLTVDEARKILDVAQSHRLAALFRVALMMGLRQGEILGLRWSDIDFETRTLRVAQTLQRVDGLLIFKEPKTAKSRRTLRIPQSVADALRVHRDQQSLERAACRAQWNDANLVFVSTKGTPLDARNVLRIWHVLQDEAGISRGPFHASRHTAVSLLIAEGVPVKVIQEVLGHSLLSTTMDTYGHLYPQAFVEAADAMDRALG